jgi:hypothetical protein
LNLLGLSNFFVDAMVSLVLYRLVTNSLELLQQSFGKIWLMIPLEIGLPIVGNINVAADGVG